jgi:hypothetical protein
VLASKLVLGGVLGLRALVSWRWLALRDDGDHERDGCCGGRLEDEDVADLCLHRMGAPKMCDLSVSALKMTKGKKTCSWPPCVEVAPCVRPTCC